MIVPLRLVVPSFLLLGCAACFAASPDVGSRDPAIDAAQAWWQAYANGDSAAVDAHTAPGATAVFSSGGVLDRADIVQEAGSHTATAGFSLAWSEESVRTPREGLVIVTGLSTERAGNSEQQFRITTVLDRGSDGQWRVLHVQSTRVARFAAAVDVGVAGSPAEFAGRYRTPKGRFITMESRGESLWMTEPGGKAFELTPIGPGLFEPKGRSPLNGILRLAFARDAQGEVASFSRLVEGRVDTFPKQDDQAASPPN